VYATTPLLLRLAASLGLVAALTIPVSAALAAPASRITTTNLSVYCDLPEDGVTSGYLVLDASGSTTAADLEVWLAPASRVFNPPTLVTSDAAVTLAPDGSDMTGSINLVSFESGEPAGSAVLAATFAPTGTPTTTERSEIGTNRKERIVETVQPLTATGSVTLPGGQLITLDGNCAGSSSTAEIFRNDPSSTVDSLDYIELKCDWQVNGIEVAIAGQADRLLSYIDIAVVTPDGSFPGSMDDATLTRSRIDASFVLQPAGQGIAATGGTAVASARVSHGERYSFTDGEAGNRVRVTIQEFIVDGTLSVSLDDGTSMTLAMNADTCRMQQVQERAIQGGNA
jgi:hypothetical protein